MVLLIYIDGEKHNKITQSFIESDGFHQLMKVTQPWYVVPSRYILKLKMLEKYEFFVKIMRTKLKLVIKFITTDILTSSFTAQSSLGITAQF